MQQPADILLNTHAASEQQTPNTSQLCAHRLRTICAPNAHRVRTDKATTEGACNPKGQ